MRERVFGADAGHGEHVLIIALVEQSPPQPTGNRALGALCCDPARRHHHRLTRANGAAADGPSWELLQEGVQGLQARDELDSFLKE
eukprot:7943981-Alexandrium_andersonii.AAC.1